MVTDTNLAEAEKEVRRAWENYHKMAALASKGGADYREGRPWGAEEADLTARWLAEAGREADAACARLRKIRQGLTG